MKKNKKRNIGQEILDGIREIKAGKGIKRNLKTFNNKEKQKK